MTGDGQAVKMDRKYPLDKNTLRKKGTGHG